IALLSIRELVVAREGRPGPPRRNGGDVEVDAAIAQQERDGAADDADHRGEPAGVIRVRRRRDEWFPVWDPDGVGIAIIVRQLDRGDRPPEAEVELAVP